MASVDSKFYFVSKNIPYSVLSFGVPWIEQTQPEGLSSELLWLCLNQPILAAVKEYGVLNGWNPCDYTSTASLNLDPRVVAMQIGILHILPEAVAMSRQLIPQVFKDIQIQGVDPVQFAQAKQVLIEGNQGLLKKVWEQNETIAAYLMSLQLRPQMNLEHQILKLKSLNKADVDRVARRLLNLDQLLWVEIGKVSHFRV